MKLLVTYSSRLTGWNVQRFSSQITYLCYADHFLSNFFLDTSVFKCVGHIYKVDDELVSSQFLVINKDAISVKPGDVVVSAQSHGFIEKVVRINQTSDMMFMETELERCTVNSTWTSK